jgi:hypothetical protein
MDLEDEFNAFSLGKITKRMLCRVARDQYDSLGLIYAYTIKFKLLMRNTTHEKGKVTSWDEEVPAIIADTSSGPSWRI